MENEKFDNATLDIVSKALKKASNGGLIFQPQYRFKMGRVEYLLNGDESPIGDSAQRCLYVFGIEPQESMFKYYIMSCLSREKAPTHAKHVVTQLFLAFTSHLIQQGHKDIAFQYRCYGSFHDDDKDVGDLRFGSALINVRMIVNKKERYFFRELNNNIPADIPDGMKDLLKDNEVVFLVRGMDKDFNVFFPLSQITDFCVDYM